MKKRGPESGIGFTVTAEEATRLMARVDRSGECWTWKGAVNPKTGYGVATLWRVRPIPIHAHRIAFAIANGGLKAGVCVMHSCDNRLCVNPGHLSIGSHLDNMRDMQAKSRQHGKFPRCRVCWMTRRAGSDHSLCGPCGSESAGVSRERARQIVERVQDLLLESYVMEHQPAQQAA